MTFQEAYKLPFTSDEIYIWTSNGEMALMATKATDMSEFLKRTCDILNGVSKPNKPVKVEYEAGEILINGKESLIVRGWGRLIGNRYKLPRNEAAKIQDDFGNWVANTLSAYDTDI